MRRIPHPAIPFAGHHSRDCWRCPGNYPGQHPAPHDNNTPSCDVLYGGSDGDMHRCTRPTGHQDTHRAGDYR